MTTICYKAGILAFDGQCTNENEIVAKNIVKAIATKKLLVGASGATAHCQAFIEWVRNGRKASTMPKPLPDDKFEGIVIDDKGCITVYEEGLLSVEFGTHPFFAIGSGAQFAIGAMEAGASALEAVKIAAKRDIYTGGEIRWVEMAKLMTRESSPAFMRGAK